MLLCFINIFVDIVNIVKRSEQNLKIKIYPIFHEIVRFSNQLYTIIFNCSIQFLVSTF